MMENRKKIDANGDKVSNQNKSRLTDKKGEKKKKNDKTFTQYYKKKTTIIELNIRWELGDNRNRWI